MTSGTSANGMPNDSTTCEARAPCDGLMPMASTIRAGVMVIARRTKSGIGGG